MVTYMARVGVPQHISDRILNHKAGVISGVAAVYQRHDFADECRDALTKWSAFLTLLCGNIKHYDKHRNGALTDIKSLDQQPALQ
jgi:hypothetical protein